MKTKAETEKQLQSFIRKFEPRHQAVIRAARKILRRQFPSAQELAYDNYNFFVIGYGATERPSDRFVSIAAAANGVGLVSSEAPVCLIPTSYCSAPENRRVSSGSSQPRSWNGQRFRPC